MKPKVLVLPLVALVVAAIWLARQRSELNDVQQKIGAIRAHIATASEASGDLASGGRPTAARSAPSGKTSINWQRLAELTANRNPGLFAKQELLRAEARIRNMTPEELVSALAEIKALNLDIRSRGELDKKLIAVLGDKDPATALDHLTDRNDHLGLPYGLQIGILAKWSRTDLTAATTWLDAKIASGDLDSKAIGAIHSPRLRLEAALLSTLIGSDTAAAAARLDHLSPLQRAEIFTEFARHMQRGETPPSESDLAAYGSLVRETLTPIQQTQAIAQPVSTLAEQRGYEKIDQYFEAIGASPAERAAGIANAGQTKFRFLVAQNRLNTGEIDSFRQWAASQAPETVDQVTANALAANALNSASIFNTAADLISHYYESTGNQELLIQFLESGSAVRYKEKARALAEQISDPDRRAQILGRLK